MRRRGRPSSGRPAGPEPAAAGARPPGGRVPQDLGRTLRDAGAALGIALPPSFPAQIEIYLAELARWQRIGSLTAYRNPAQQVRHLVIESLMLLAALPEPASPLLDIGTGPGVPGLILKLVRPDWEVVLIEAVQRRTNFLRHVVRQLGVPGVRVVWGRAEALAGGELAGRFRTVTMRAVATGDAARALAAPYLAPESSLVVPLGPTASYRGGSRREITLAVPGELPWRRQFLIIRQTEQT